MRGEPKRYRVKHRPDIFNESRTGAWVVEYVGGPPEGVNNAFASMRPLRSKEEAETEMARLEAEPPKTYVLSLKSLQEENEQLRALGHEMAKKLTPCLALHNWVAFTGGTDS